MLYQMYVHYAEDKGWKVTVLDLVPGEGIGLDRATIQIEGRYAYGMLRSEIDAADASSRSPQARS